MEQVHIKYKCLEMTLELQLSEKEASPDVW